MMKDEWDDEARRAYQQGYWDARRELEGRNEQSDRSGRGQAEEQRMRPHRGGLEDRSDVRGRRGQDQYQQATWLPDHSSQRPGDSSGRQEEERFRGGDANYRRGWNDDEGGYRRNWTDTHREHDRAGRSDMSRGQDERWQNHGRIGYESSEPGSDRGQWERLPGGELHAGGPRGVPNRSGGRDLDPRVRTDLRGPRERFDDRERDPFDDERRDRRHDNERGFLERAGEEIKSWFGGDEDRQRDYERRRGYSERGDRDRRESYPRDDDERPYISR